jgi:hypothetical protein
MIPVVSRSSEIFIVYYRTWGGAGSAPERWVWLFDDRHIAAAAESCGRFADNPQLDFTFNDATRVVRAIREQARNHNLTGSYLL